MVLKDPDPDWSLDSATAQTNSTRNRRKPHSASQWRWKGRHRWEEDWKGRQHGPGHYHPIRSRTFSTWMSHQSSETRAQGRTRNTPCRLPSGRRRCKRELRGVGGVWRVRKNREEMVEGGAFCSLLSPARYTRKGKWKGGGRRVERRGAPYARLAQLSLCSIRDCLMKTFVRVDATENHSPIYICLY